MARNRLATAARRSTRAPQRAAATGEPHDPASASAETVGDFRPHPLLAHPHLQTLFPFFARPLPALAIRRERIELPDGDFVDLGWSGGDASRDAPLAVLVHGLTGGFESKYLRGLAQSLVARGWRTAMLQLRGGGDEPNRLPQSYHQGDTADLRHVLRLLRRREQPSALALVGWSLGGNIVLKAMGEEGDAAPADFAAAASVPFRLWPCVERLRRGFSQNYQARMLTDLKLRMRKKHARVPAPAGVDLAAAERARDFVEYDEAYTAPINGFHSADDYYRRSECAPFLAQIRRPTLIVHASDDPFMEPSIVPAAATLSPDVRLEVTARGGHVGFVASGRLGRPVYWLEQRLAAFLEDQRARLRAA